VKSFVTACGAGLLFGTGLVVSGMTNPNKVIGFLDFFGHWDPSLLCVMVGAIGVHAPLYWFLQRRASLPERATQASLPSQLSLPSPKHKPINAKLIVGAILFGIGWGLGGYCPGPAIASLATGHNALVVCVAILVGVLVHELFFGALSRRTVAEPPLNNGSASC
jgi:uncharacterized membrane protein YedE/YeeE